MEIIISQRSGIVVGIIEAVILLIFSPIITRGTNHIYNYVTTRSIFSGKPVKIIDTSMSVEDVIPRTFRLFRSAFTGTKSWRKTDRPSVTRQLMTLTISLCMTAGILLVGIFIDGKTVPVYEKRQLVLWNGGKFVDTTKNGQNGRAGDVLGMAAVRSACVEPTAAGEFNLFAVAFFEKQYFEGENSANDTVCIDGVRTSQKIGIKLSTNRIFNPPGEVVYKEDMEGEPANFTFLSEIDRVGTPDFCRVTVKTAATSENWTFGSQTLYGATRFAARAIREQDGTIVLHGGVAYHNVDSPEADNKYDPDETCESLTADMFAGNRFRATIVEIGARQDLRQLELVVTDMMYSLVFNGYGQLESQDIMLHSYYAGRTDSEEASGEDLGTFEAQDFDLRVGERQVTVISAPAIVGIGLVLLGTLMLLVAGATIRPAVRLTSTAYVSALYRSDRVQDGLCLKPREVDVVGMTRQGEKLHIGPVREGDEVACIEPGVPIGKRAARQDRGSFNHIDIP